MNNDTNKGVKASFKSKSFRVGGYSVAVIIAVVAIVVVMNLVVNGLPTAYTKLDTSSNALYSISEETETIVKSISEDITVYFIAGTGAQDTTIDELLGRYVSLNSHIKVKYIDPATNPNFISQYTDKTLSDSSLIFVSAKRSTPVDYSEIYVTSYSEEEMQNYYYYGTIPTGSTAFAGENAITGALEYVTSESIPVLYTLSGHGETEFDSAMAGYIDSDNIIVSTLSLLTEESVPEDASAVVIKSPQNDVSADEAEKLQAYLNAGGHLIIMTDYTNTDMPNLFSLTSAYGAEFNQGIIIEGNHSYYMSGYPYFVIPKMKTSDISSLITNTNINIAMPYAHGITKSASIADGITYTSLLSSSAAAYMKTDVANIETLEKVDGDPTGQYDLGVLLTDGNTGGSIVWFASSYIADSSIDSYVSGGNSTFFLSTLTYLCEKEASVSIAAKSMQVAALVVDDLSSNIWSAVITVIIPVAILAGGLIYWMKRRKV